MMQNLFARVNSVNVVKLTNYATNTIFSSTIEHNSVNIQLNLDFNSVQ